VRTVKACWPHLALQSSTRTSARRRGKIPVGSRGLVPTDPWPCR
jgi:hypothetical protein